ncbi:MAG: SRPBCC domain-containing protein [Sphingobacteriales bacterium]|nr:MAG: SRPBCC domain-containing protein [Sphingobacteriales bacterium]
MLTLDYRIQINTTPEKVWTALWDFEHYKTWTRPFCEGSYFKTDGFKQGNRIHFLVPEGEGLYAVIDKVEPEKYMAFRHLGSVENFEELPPEKEPQPWPEMMEIYRLSPNENGTEVWVSVDTLETYASSIGEKFPLALSELKTIAENL